MYLLYSIAWFQFKWKYYTKSVQSSHISIVVGIFKVSKYFIQFKFLIYLKCLNCGSEIEKSRITKCNILLYYSLIQVKYQLLNSNIFLNECMNDIFLEKTFMKYVLLFKILYMCTFSFYLLIIVLSYLFTN